MPRRKHRFTFQETKRFIGLVRENDSIYNVNLPTYRDNEYVQNVWIRIADSMGRNDLDGLEWKKKWRNMRDAYVKKRRLLSGKSGKVADRAKEWRFFEMLSFLNPYVESSTGSDIPSIWKEEIENDDDESRASTERSSMVPDPLSDLHSSIGASRVTETKMNREYEQGPGSLEKAINDLIRQHKKILEELEKKSAQTPPLMEAEGLFFKTCAEKMKKLPPQTRSYLELQISQLFFNAENPSMQVPIMPLPSEIW